MNTRSRYSRMFVLSADNLFLALDVGRFLRRITPLQGALIFLAIALVGCGIVYLVYLIKSVSGLEEGTEAERAHLQEKMAKKRDRLLKKREKILEEIPSGPIEEHDLPQASLRIRSRIQEIPSDAEFSIGKASENDLAIAELGVSRHHAKIRPEKGGYILYDMGSSRGTFVNNEKIDKTVLREGDKIRVGPETLVFHVEKATGPGA